MEIYEYCSYVIYKSKYEHKLLFQVNAYATSIQIFTHVVYIQGVLDECLHDLFSEILEIECLCKLQKYSVKGGGLDHDAYVYI